MKKTLMLVVFILCLLSAGVWAQDQENTDQRQAKGPAMLMPPPQMPAMPSFGQSQKIVVATSDGGIVIVQGNNITKFDKNLNITKSVELEENKSQ